MGGCVLAVKCWGVSADVAPGGVISVRQGLERRGQIHLASGIFTEDAKGKNVSLL